MSTFNLDELLTHWAKERPNDLAFADENNRVTFADINMDARKVANALLQSGVSRGDLAVIALPPYLAWTFSFALQLLGVTILPKSVEVKYPENFDINWYIGLTPDSEIATTKTILFTNEFLEKIKTLPPIERAPGYSNPHDPIFLFSTSGTTGLKKYVAYEASQFTDEGSPMWPKYFYGEQSVFSLFPYGGAGSTVLALKRFASGSLYANTNIVDERTISLIEEFNIKFLVGAPTQILGLLELCKSKDLSVPQIDLIVTGGTASPSKLLERFKSEFNCKLYDHYGSSESGSVARAEFIGSASIGLTPDSIGEIQIVNEFDQPVNEGVVGQIRHKRLGMCHSYYKNESATKQFFKEGYFYPGDSGFINEAGLLVLSGRVTEVINLGGVKLNPTEIEDRARRVSGVLDCAAFAIPGRDGLDELAIAIVSAESFNIDGFQASMANPAQWSKIHVFLVDSIPYNPNGKVMRAQLSQKFAQ